MKNIFTVLEIESLDLCLDKASETPHTSAVKGLNQICFQIKSHYNIMMETIKQTSFQNIQGDLGGHMEMLSMKDGAGKAQPALTLHKVDMEASVMEVSLRNVCFNKDLIKFSCLVLSISKTLYSVIR